MTTSTTSTQTETLNAENVLHLVPEVDMHLSQSHKSHDTSHDDLQGYDEEQIRLMDEVCIVLDEDDKPIGSASKKICHLMSNINKGLLHRAFSCFLFDSNNRLLLQQRASEKITFPDMWTNTCCSHPLGVPSETGSTLPASIAGAQRAAQRKLGHELGIPAQEVPLDQFHFLTRIHYKAPNGGDDGIWGEHEIDYILFIRPKVDNNGGEKSISGADTSKRMGGQVTLDINKNEVQNARYVTREELKALFKDGEGGEIKFTPWFRLICDQMLWQWWDRLCQDGGSMENLKPDEDIRRML